MRESVLVEKRILEKPFADLMKFVLEEEGVRVAAFGTREDIEAGFKSAGTGKEPLSEGGAGVWRSCENACNNLVTESFAALVYTREAAALMAKMGIAAAAYSDAENADLEFEGVKYLVTSLEGIDADFFRLIRARYLGKPLVIAHTERLEIRELAGEDFDAFYAMLKASPAHTIESIPMESGEACREWFDSYIRTKYEFYDYGYWGVFDREGELVGSCGIETVELPSRAGAGGSAEGSTSAEPGENEVCSRVVNELGYMVAPAHRGKGYATEAVLAVIGYAKKLMMDSVVCRVSRDNDVSARTIEAVIERGGFSFSCSPGAGDCTFYEIGIKG